MKYLFVFAVLLTYNKDAKAQAKVFAPGIISNGEQFGMAMAPNGNALFFVRSFGGRDTLRIYQSQRIKRKWRKPYLAFFANTQFKQIDPSISPDGKTILFNSLASAEKGFDIYAVYLNDTGWSAPHLLPETINSYESDFYATMAGNGNMYFTRRTGSNDIYFSKKTDTGYTKAEPLDSIINTPKNESNPYIAPDESYLIFFADRADSYGESDLYISFREGGKWSVPQNLGNKINTASAEFCPSVDVRGKRFLFSRTEEKYGRRKENMYSIPLKELSFDALKKTAVFR
jgi:Tol biopolymer transport system component